MPRADGEVRRRAGLTAIVLLVPVIELVAVRLAVRVWLPAVLSVAMNVPVPLASVLSAGKTAGCRCS